MLEDTANAYSKLVTADISKKVLFFPFSSKIYMRYILVGTY